jgi:predicted DNA-binding protein (UPF0251 family)
LHEKTLGGVVEVVPSSQAFTPAPTDLPEFDELTLRENRVLQAYYQQGMKIVKIAKRYRIKKSAVKSMLARSRGKVATIYANSEGK